MKYKTSLYSCFKIICVNLRKMSFCMAYPKTIVLKAIECWEVIVVGEVVWNHTFLKRINYKLFHLKNSN